MPTTTVGFCVDLAERKILDESNDEYSEQNLLDLYHLAIKEIIKTCEIEPLHLKGISESVRAYQVLAVEGLVV